MFEDIAPTTLAAPAFILSVIWEWWAVKSGHANGNYETKDAVTSLAMGAGNLVVNTLTGAISLWMMMLLWNYRLIDIPVTWWSGLLLFVLYDFIYYWKHRLAHRMRWFWMEHVTHHSSRQYNLTTALRQPWFGPFSGLILLGTPLVLTGFHPLFIFFVASLNLVYQFWIHTEVIDRMPRWFEAVMNTPSHHRVHHAINPRYLDTNYAGVFIVWDKMFGSFVPELESDPPVYGIVEPLESYNPITVAFHEAGNLARDCWRDGPRPDRWVRRFVNGPGWQPNGEHNRSSELKAAYLAEHPDQAGTPGFPKA
ncbi:sterol desaturase family protein [Henriciella pelagia]|uniref:Fatty acid hydroxylase n=1 Tax=Henriciella pelagia TaxID=1977912 RepID=A0ABQ1J2T6_9PROT|nr:sterol desaturase family protein [Henriciella pelagia]GGB56049.1 fatty acid hydroxylase [Henriciella pelagia]